MNVKRLRASVPPWSFFPFLSFHLFIVLAATGALARADSPTSRPAYASGFANEQNADLIVQPAVKVRVNRPAGFDAAKPTLLVLYALPNGNTIDWTAGRATAPGEDWHYVIQHIAAQTRRLRELSPQRQIVVAYLEAEGRSWPTWKAKRPDHPKLIDQVIRQVREAAGCPQAPIVLTGHSGGGGFTFGWLDHLDKIPAEVERIVLLDSNYAYDNDKRHGDKLLEWLGRTKGVLSVVAYDDREITLNGKKVVGPTGGTWRATHRMMDRLRKDLELTSREDGDLLRITGLEGRIDIILHRNPANKILHTVLVGEMSGYVHGLTVASPLENRAAVFGDDSAWQKWIQPAPATRPTSRPASGPATKS